MSVKAVNDVTPFLFTIFLIFFCPDQTKTFKQNYKLSRNQLDVSSKILWFNNILIIFNKLWGEYWDNLGVTEKIIEYFAW